jgi:hypothetical protein
MYKYPVISITLQDIDGDSFDTAAYYLQEVLSRKFDRHNYLLNSSTLNHIKSEFYQKIWEQKTELYELSESLKFLSKCLLYG